MTDFRYIVRICPTFSRRSSGYEVPGGTAEQHRSIFAMSHREVEAANNKFQHSIDVFAGQEVVLRDFTNGHLREILKYKLNGHSGISEQPPTATFAWDAFHGGALRPIERRHHTCKASPDTPDPGADLSPSPHTRT